MVVLLVLLTVAVVVAVLVRAFRAADEASGATGQALEDPKVAKYRELRDLDWRTGKLSADDYRRTRGQPRERAAELLERTTPGAERPTSANGSST